VCELIEPDRPLRINLYRCDKAFYVEPLRQLIQTENLVKVLGIVWVTGNECRLLRVKGTECVKQGGTSTYRQGSSRKGGQSAPRFQRIRDQQVTAFGVSITDVVENAWYDAEVGRVLVDGIVVCGSGPVFRAAKVGKKLADRVIGRITAQLCKPFELYAKFAPKIDQADAQGYEQLLTAMLDTGSPLLVYGSEHLQRAVSLAELETLYVTERNATPALRKACLNVGCTLLVTRATQTLRTLGGAVGVRWYAQAQVNECKTRAK
jgi:peptide chain release factor subunit 1